MSLIKSVATVSSFTVISRITGFIRDVLIARFLGASMVADAFFIALKLPNLFRSMFAEGAFNSAFVPLFTEELELKGKDKARRFVSDTFSALFYILAVFTAVVEIIMPLVVIILAPGFLEVEGKVALTSDMCRLTFPFLLLISLNSMQGGILNSLGKFAAPAFTSTILNLTMITALFALSPLWQGETGAAFSLCLGVVIAGVIQFVFLWWHLKRQNMVPILISPFKVFFYASKEMSLLLKRTLPGVVGAGIYQINLVIDTFFVSFLASGAVSWLYYANRLFQLPVGVLGAAIGTALLPMLARQVKTENQDEETAVLSRAVEMAVLVSVPAALGLAVLDRAIVASLFEYGQFTYNETIKTAAALSAFALGLPAYVVSKSLLPCFFARGDTKSPVRVAFIALFLNAVLCFTLMQKYGHIGIALATSITAWVNLFQYYFMLRRRGFLHLDKKVKSRIPRIIISGILMALVVQGCLYAAEITVPEWMKMDAAIRVGILVSLISVGGIAFVLLTLLTGTFKVQDLKRIFRRVG